MAARLRPDEASVLVWAVPGVLAVTQRPLRDHPDYPGRVPFPSDAAGAIETWVDRALAHGIRTMIVLTSERELTYYETAMDSHGGLLGLYRLRGLEVVHLPTDDPAHDVRAAEGFATAVDEIADKAMDALRRVPLPALMHCSAAVDRSPPVAGRITFLIEDCSLLESAVGR